MKKINDAPVCFGSRDDTYGTFNIKESGLIHTFKLVHRNGYLHCNTFNPPSFWDCDHSSYGDKRLLTVITFPNKTALLPTDFLRDDSGCGNYYYSYQITGIGVNAADLCLTSFQLHCQCLLAKSFKFGMDKTW